MILNPASSEQIKIIETLKNSNVIVNAVAGSGKTTTNLHIATTFKEKKILLLTYNKDLKIDSRKRVELLGLKNIDVHSFHSFCVRYYSKKAYDDNGIIKITDNDTPSRNPINYDIIVIDEIQDINSLYYELICKIIKDNDLDCKIAILGDIHQCINHWNHADHRYIQFVDELFCFNEYDWVNCNLSTSYRITDEISSFVNNCLLDNQRINTIKSNKKVKYLICDTFKKNIILEYLQDYLDQGYTYDDIFILAPSVKSSQKIKPVQILANALTKNNIPIYVPNSDDKELDKDELIGKIVFSTFHQAKGRERKITIVYNFDESYFTFFAKNRNPYTCPNELYVAVTRSSEQLMVIHHYNNDYLPFINKSKLEQFTNIIYETPIYINNKTEKKNLDTAVTDLTRHLPSKIIKHCLTYFTSTKVQDIDNTINIPVKIKQNTLIESVSEITGIAIPSYFELLHTGSMTILKQPNLIIDCKPKEYLFLDDDDDNDNNVNYKKNESDILSNCVDNLKEISPSQLLFIANKWNAFKTGYQFKVNQINDYNWLSQSNLDLCIKRLEKKISHNANYEVPYSVKENKELLNRKLNAYFDCIEDDKLWEFKCVKTLKSEHFLQLAIYMYIHKENIQNKKDRKDELLNFKNNQDIMDFFFVNFIPEIEKSSSTPDYKYYLFNILTNEIYQLSACIDILKEMIEYLINYKYYSSIIITDKEFIKNNIKIYNKYFIIE